MFLEIVVPRVFCSTVSSEILALFVVVIVIVVTVIASWKGQ